MWIGARKWLTAALQWERDREENSEWKQIFGVRWLDRKHQIHKFNRTIDASDASTAFNVYLRPVYLTSQSLIDGIAEGV